MDAAAVIDALGLVPHPEGGHYRETWRHDPGDGTRGAGTAIVGSYDQVAERIGEYQTVGVNRFILSGYPNLEEARRVGEQVLPRLRDVAPRPLAA